MGRFQSQGRRALTRSVTGLGVLVLTSGVAVAGEALPQSPASSDPASIAALQAQVQQLTQLVQSLSARDQAQIQDLTSQVHALQSQVQSQPIATQSARPRASQNATENFTLPPAQVAADPNMAIPRVTQNASHRFAFQSADGQYSIGLTGDVQFDTGAYLNFHQRSGVVGPQDLSDGANARRARIGVTGTTPGGFSYAFVYDAGNSQDTAPKGIQTAQIVYGGIRGAAAEIGYSNTFFTLDQSTSSNDLMFLERASASNIATNFNAGDARANAGLRLFGDQYWVGGYLTGPASGDSHTLTGERFGAFERVAVQALKGPNYSLHLGVGVDELLRAPNTGNGTPNVLTLSDEPELRIDPTTFLNTGALGSVLHPVTGGDVIDIETAANYGPLFWQGEYYRYDVVREGLPHNDFEGGYGEISYTLTGEARAYNPQAASYFRIVPSHPFSLTGGGWGAWEIASRLSYVDLDSKFKSGEALSAYPDAVDGGVQHGLTVGLNWYPNDIVRFLLDFNHVTYDKADGAAVKGAALGTPVGASFDAVSFRAQVAY